MLRHYVIARKQTKIFNYFFRSCWQALCKSLFPDFNGTRDQEEEMRQSQCSHVDVFMSTCRPDNYAWLTGQPMNGGRHLSSDGKFRPIASLQIGLCDLIGHMSKQPTNHVSRDRSRHLWFFASSLCAHASFWHASDEPMRATVWVAGPCFARLFEWQLFGPIGLRWVWERA